MNKKLYFDVTRVLKIVGELPYADARLCLETAIDILGKYSYIDFDTFNDDVDKLEEDEGFGDKNRTAGNIDYI